MKDFSGDLLLDNCDVEQISDLISYSVKYLVDFLSQLSPDDSRSVGLCKQINDSVDFLSHLGDFQMIFRSDD